MKKISRLLFSLFLLLYVSTGLAFAKGQLSFCMEASPVFFIPALTSDAGSFHVAEQIYNQLFQLEPGTGKLTPALATSWTISKDQKVYTLHLRKGVKFQTTKYFTPKRNFNADDVLFSFDMQKNKKNPFHKMGGSSFEYYASMDFSTLIKKIEKVDEHTVKFYLSRKESPFIADLAIPAFGIVSKEYADQIIKQGKDIMTLSNQPVGTGPFTFYSYKKDSFIRFTANKTYWEGSPKLDRLTFLIVPNSATRTVQLQKGECDIISYPNTSDIAKLEKDPNIKVKKVTGVNVGFIGINHLKKPFNNVLVRKALNYAVNKKVLIKSIYIGHAIEANGIVPPTVWSFNKNIVKYPYNLKKAKRLLAKAGYPNGFKANLWAMPVSRPYMPNAKRAAEIVQADWKKIGVNVKIISYEWGEYLRRLRTNGTGKDLFFMGWSADTTDPDNFLYVLASCAAAKNGSNYSSYCNKKFDKLILKAKQITNHKTRLRLYKKAEAILAKDATVIPIAHAQLLTAVRKRVHNYILDPMEVISFFKVTVQ